jgi:hypothetical protein
MSGLICDMLGCHAFAAFVDTAGLEYAHCLPVDTVTVNDVLERYCLDLAHTQL